MENLDRSEIIWRYGMGSKEIKTKTTALKKAAELQRKLEESRAVFTHSLDPNNLSFWVTLTLLTIAALVLYADHQQSRHIPDRHFTPNRMIITDRSITETQSPIFNAPHK